ncbi:S41 family peptidase [Flavobacterium sp.]|uniref:S41 family peptidase n=1 Tax=Flavobacterium sp. TaxID=239 RepID=UPI00262966F8|nr:S41 family peptidase [Flavobacterium sp.]
MYSFSSTLKSFLFLGGILLFLLMGCHSGKTTHNLSAESKEYLDEVLELLQTKSVNRNKIDWDAFTTDVFYFARNSQTIKETYPAVRYAITKLGDNHSYFNPAINDIADSEEKTLPVFEDEVTPSDIGYIRIPFCIGDTAQTATYIQTINDKITAQNNPKIKGWIVDLRDNFGGNMWPMMASIGSLLQSGTQGYFLDANDKPTEWRYDNGKAYSDTVLLAENKNVISAYGKNKIAVLINTKTASSGEAMAVLFKGYSQAKLFGSPTFGVSTGCESFPLSDGSRINLATSVFADQHKNKYGNAIIPDIPGSDSEVLISAMKWIYN